MDKQLREKIRRFLTEVLSEKAKSCFSVSELTLTDEYVVTEQGKTQSVIDLRVRLIET